MTTDTKSAPAKSQSTLAVPFERRSVRITFTNRVVGGIPQDPNLINGWLTANMKNVTDAERAKLAETTLAEVGRTVEDAAAGMWTTFKRDERGLYIEGRQLKSAYREAANILRDIFIKQETKGDAKKSRFTALKSKLAERLWVLEDKLYLYENARPDAKILQKPSGTEERAIHVMTAQGPRNALKRYDFCGEGTTVKFTLKWLKDGIVDEELVAALHEYMPLNGLGADRSQGNGLFDVEMQGEKKAA